MPFRAPSRSGIDTGDARATGLLRRTLHRILWSRAWDFAGRALGVSWTGLLFVVGIRNLFAFEAAHRGESTHALVYLTALAARGAFLAFLLLLMVFFVLRLRPRAKVRGLGARVVAVVGTFSPTLLGVLPRYEESTLLNVASLICVAVGNVLSIYGMIHLSRSASIMAEARHLVTTGPYRIVQHPVYLFEEIAVVGVLLPFLWPPGVAVIALPIFAVHVWCQFRRMRLEEDVLAATFPDHETYRQRTRRLVPGVY